MLGVVLGVYVVPREFHVAIFMGVFGDVVSEMCRVLIEWS